MQRITRYLAGGGCAIKFPAHLLGFLYRVRMNLEIAVAIGIELEGLVFVARIFGTQIASRVARGLQNNWSRNARGDGETLLGSDSGDGSGLGCGWNGETTQQKSSQGQQTARVLRGHSVG